MGKPIPNHKKIELFVDGWKMHELQDYHTGRTEIEETPFKTQEILESKQEKYLGQINSIDGTNVKNILNQAAKGAGMAKLIEGVLNYVPRGKFHFETAMIFRNVHLFSSMLSCSEVWYGLTEWDLRKLEQTDENLLRHILNCSSQVTSDVLSLELGLLPVRFIIKLRRITYLHHIMNQRNEKITKL